MGSHLIQTEDKLFMYMRHATSGMAETDSNGIIVYKNPQAETILQVLMKTYNVCSNNVFDLLKTISPEEADKLKNFVEKENDEREVSILVPLQIEKEEKEFRFTVCKTGEDSCIVTFEDLTRSANNINKPFEEAILDKAVAQEKFQIAANVLHDIGNAVIGLSSYITKIKKSLEQDNSENLQNLAGFFKSQHDAISVSIGTAKADAIVKLVSGIAQTQKTIQQDINNSNTELQKIITHIQDILNIQRQYISGVDTMEQRQISLKGIVNDCISMLLASFKKRDIDVSLDIRDNLPLFNGDRTKLMQVILNILKNSIEAIDVYAINKTVSIIASADSNSLQLKIQDSGKGFDAETGKKIFTRGFTTKKTGTGLGLEHCRGILQAHGGSIDITSEGPGKGALTIIKFKI